MKQAALHFKHRPLTSTAPTIFRIKNTVIVFVSVISVVWTTSSSGRYFVHHLIKNKEHCNWVNYTVTLFLDLSIFSKYQRTIWCQSFLMATVVWWEYLFRNEKKSLNICSNIFICVTDLCHYCCYLSLSQSCLSSHKNFFAKLGKIYLKN